MAEHNETGKKGENLASQYLVDNGYSIIAHNWRFGNNEIDIIALKNDVLVIVEVKTRSSYFAAEAVVTIPKSKQKFLVKAANAFIQKNNYDIETRFDIITIIIENNRQTVKHIEDAFYPTL